MVRKNFKYKCTCDAIINIDNIIDLYGNTKIVCSKCQYYYVYYRVFSIKVVKPHVGINSKGGSTLKTRTYLKW